MFGTKSSINLIEDNIKDVLIGNAQHVIQQIRSSSVYPGHYSIRVFVFKLGIVFVHLIEAKSLKFTNGLYADI